MSFLSIEALNREYSDRSKVIADELSSAQTLILDSSTWSNTKNSLEKTDNLANEYSKLSVISDFNIQNSDINNLIELKKETVSLYNEKAGEAFVRFNHTGKNYFFDLYPVKIESQKKIFDENYSPDIFNLQTASEQEIINFYSNYT